MSRLGVSRLGLSQLIRVNVLQSESIDVLLEAVKVRVELLNQII